MVDIVTRAAKGSALTFAEADANFTNLKTSAEALEALATTSWMRTGVGTAAAPSFSFLTDTDTGLLRSSANAVGFAGNGALAFTATGVATGVNYVGVTNAIATASPGFAAVGADTNISIGFTPKGTGSVTATTAFTAPRFALSPTATQIVVDFATLAAGSPQTADNILASAWQGKMQWRGSPKTVEAGYLGYMAPWKFAFTDRTHAADTDPIAAMAIAYAATGNNTTNTTNKEEQRTGLSVEMSVTGVYGSTAATIGDDPTYLAMASEQINWAASANQGGTGGWDGIVNPASPIFRGAGFGLNVLSILRTGATNWNGMVGVEVVNSILTGASVYQNIGLRVGKKDDSVVQGEADVAFEISNQTGCTTGWKHGYLIGRDSGNEWPIDPTTGVCFGVIGRTFPTVRTRANQLCAYGLDLRAMTASVASIAANLFEVNDAGRMTSATRRLTQGTLGTAEDVTGDDVILIRTSTNATLTRLTFNAAAPNSTNSLPIPNNSSVTYTFVCLARQTAGTAGTVGDWAVWRGSYTIRRASGASTASIQEIVSEISAALGARTSGTAFAPSANATGAAAWRLTINQDTTNGGSAISGTGELDKTIKWLIRLQSVQTIN